MKSIVNLGLVCLLCSGILGANAATHYLVPTNNTGGAINPYDSWGTAGTSVIDVVNAAMTNGTTPRIVWVTNGAYILTNTVTITNDVALRGFNGRDATIFNGNAAWRFVMQHSNCVLDGLTITNGYSGSGGGILITGGTVTNCIIANCVCNSAADDSGGGGIRITGTGVVVNCIIRRNTKSSGSAGGGGIATKSGCNATIQDCIIENNLSASGSGHGGGLSVGNTTFIRNCLIRYNMATNQTVYGGGIMAGGTNVHIINCTIVSNRTFLGDGGGIAFSVSQTNTVINCIIVSNVPNNIGGYATPFSSCAYSCSKPANAFFSLTGTSNTISDPGFTSFTGENYRFNRTSPCFNSGTNQPDWMNSAVDLDGHPRILHGTADMGAYELFIPSGAMYRFR